VKKILPILVICFFVIGWLKFWPGSIRAADSSLSISPQSALKGGNATLNFQISNLSSTATYKWVRFTSGSPDVVTFGLLEAEGWSYMDGPTEITFYNDTGIGPGLSQNFSVEIGAEDIEADVTISASVSESPAGTDASSGGSATLSIVGSVQVNPVISGVSLSIGSSSATVSWNTDLATTSRVDYGTSTGYGSSNTGSSYINNHSLTMNGLSASTTYHFKLTNVDANGGTVTTSDLTFTTVAAGIAATTATVATTTTAAPVILKDSNLPTISLTTDFSKPYKIAPEILGRALDTGVVNAGVYGVDYSTDGGQNWLPVDDISGKGKAVQFAFMPSIYEDGNYKIKVRARDNSGNIGASKTYTLVIDRLPPMIGANMISLGPLVLTPNKDGVVRSLAGLNQKITFSAVGGPIQIILTANKKEYAMASIPGTSLWSGNLNFTEPGIYSLETTSVDGANNITHSNLGKVEVLPEGNITTNSSDNAVITVYSQNRFLKYFSIWDGQEYGIENPIKASDKYSLMLPSGKYYLTVQSKGKKTLISNIFSVDKISVINTDFVLEPLKHFGIGGLTINIPEFPKQVNIAVNNEFSEGVVESIDKELPPATLYKDGKEVLTSELTGERYVMVISSSWYPMLSNQISFIEKIKDIPIKLVLSQENQTKAQLMKIRGNYKVDLYTDPDGTLQKDLKLINLPVNLLINEKGNITKIFYGVLDSEGFSALTSE
jgi:hypothetical protein